MAAVLDRTWLPIKGRLKEETRYGRLLIMFIS